MLVVLLALSNTNVKNKQLMGCEAQLYRPVIWTSKVGQGDLVFDVQSGFASRSVCAGLQVSVYSDYDLCHPDCPKI